MALYHLARQRRTYSLPPWPGKELRGVNGGLGYHLARVGVSNGRSLSTRTYSLPPRPGKDMRVLIGGWGYHLRMRSNLNRNAGVPANLSRQLQVSHF